MEIFIHVLIPAKLPQGKFHVQILISCLLLVIAEKHYFFGVINLIFLCIELILSKVESLVLIFLNAPK